MCSDHRHRGRIDKKLLDVVERVSRWRQDRRVSVYAVAVVGCAGHVLSCDQSVVISATEALAMGIVTKVVRLAEGRGVARDGSENWLDGRAESNGGNPSSVAAGNGTAIEQWYVRGKRRPSTRSELSGMRRCAGRARRRHREEQTNLTGRSSVPAPGNSAFRDGFDGAAPSSRAARKALVAAHRARLCRCRPTTSDRLTSISECIQSCRGQVGAIAVRLRCR